MNVEILIHANVNILEDDDIEALREEIIERTSTCMSKFAGEHSHNGMFGYLKNVDHEVAFDDEGTFEWRKNDQISL